MSRAAKGRQRLRVVKDDQEPAAVDDRHVILVNTEEKDVNDRALEALEDDPDLYVRGGRLVTVTPEHRPSRVIRPTGALTIAPLAEASIRERLAAVAAFKNEVVTHDSISIVPAHPPAFVYKAIASRGHYPHLRPLESVTRSPVLLPDGGILQEPGYDQGTGILYVPNAQYPTVPDNPSKSDAEAAVKALLEPVEDFPFASPTARSVYVAALLTPLARPAISGPVPCTVVDSNVRGSGKGLLVSVMSQIATGTDVARTSYTANQEEQRKAILSIALAAVPTVLLDNVATTFGSPVYDAVFTATEWRDRVLGESKVVTVPLMCSWFVTGNNIVIRGDTARRCMHLRLESPLENPEERNDFEQPRLLDHVKAERPRLTVAALTVLRAYFCAGKPTQRLKPWGSFEGWSDLIRHCLVWLDLPDPGDTRLELQASGEGTTLRDLVEGLAEILADKKRDSATARDICQGLARKSSARFRDALDELLTEPTWGDLPPTPRQVGAILRAYRGRVVAGRAIDRLGRKTKTGQLWCVRRVGDSGDSGDSVLTRARTRGKSPRKTRAGKIARHQSLQSHPKAASMNPLDMESG